MNGDMREIAETAATKAVHETFRMFGVDTDSQASVNEFRSDLVFVRRQRKLSETVRGKVVLVVVGAIAVFGMSLVWTGIKAKFGL